MGKLELGTWIEFYVVLMFSCKFPINSWVVLQLVIQLIYRTLSDSNEEVFARAKGNCTKAVSKLCRFD